MNLLNELRPAETLLLLNRNNVSWLKILKLTAADFFIRKILRLEQEIKKPDKKSRETTYNYVVAGANFPYYKTRIFERSLVLPYYKLNRYKIQLKTLIGIMIENSAGAGKMKRDMIAELPMRNYFKQHFLFRILGILSYTQEGREAARQVAAELEELNQVFRNAANNKIAAIEAVRKTGAHALILANIDKQIFNEIEFLSHLSDDELEKELKQDHKKVRDGEWHIVYSSFPLLPVHYNSRRCSGGACGNSACGGDSGCGGHSGCGGSGCSGCGGGCSGCGGCGGCGS